jgi:hypothetical protein
LRVLVAAWCCSPAGFVSVTCVSSRAAHACVAAVRRTTSVRLKGKQKMLYIYIYVSVLRWSHSNALGLLLHVRVGYIRVRVVRYMYTISVYMSVSRRSHSDALGLLLHVRVGYIRVLVVRCMYIGLYRVGYTRMHLGCFCMSGLVTFECTRSGICSSISRPRRSHPDALGLLLHVRVGYIRVHVASYMT